MLKFSDSLSLDSHTLAFGCYVTLAIVKFYVFNGIDLTNSKRCCISLHVLLK